ncbi:hypothetical protein ACFO25_09825 [Paenactinomyces guangxiensis]|uniref:Uncharacterized protein n=1 Tax=Paenactinomyces guangxiensis TaxID=1490290 RepID=A0A7W1WSA4_9BACL|nr:hypothetical protein [Paenactinomyces guangxiensis]MBA4495082.1 hypothetical protein [Paenactinomyces guangxiensis]MBH8592234.1 hypothetical protein [Paenactinomyces guangxiensis]
MKLKAKAIDLNDEWIEVDLLETDIRHAPDDGVTYFENISGCYDPVAVDRETIQIVQNGDENVRQ